jgi:hypothetical protein
MGKSRGNLMDGKLNLVLIQIVSNIKTLNIYDLTVPTGVRRIFDLTVAGAKAV